MPFDYSHWRAEPKMACFHCRKCFKNRPFSLRATCPDCGDELHSMGTHFKSPKRNDEKHWEAIQMLYEAGVRFDVFDLHDHYWSRQYQKRGQSFDEFALEQVLSENGVRLKRVSPDVLEMEQSESKPGTPKLVAFPWIIHLDTTEHDDERDRWKPHSHQWKGPRPTHPRDVPAFLEWWRQQDLDRIAMVVEICDRLGYVAPPGARGEILLAELNKRFGKA